MFLLNNNGYSVPSLYKIMKFNFSISKTNIHVNAIGVQNGYIVDILYCTVYTSFLLIFSNREFKI